MCYTGLISTILDKCKKVIFKTTTIWSFVFLLLVLGFNALVTETRNVSAFNARDYGGPVLSPGDGSFSVETASLTSRTVPGTALGETGARAAYSAALLGLTEPSTNLSVERNGVKRYKIQKGDTFSSIAARFGISLETLRYANPDKKETLKIGDELVLLPISGILYTVRDGDTLESVSARYRIDLDAVARYNADYRKKFENPGSRVILPNAKPLEDDYVRRYENGLPDLKNYFTLPAVGWNWGELHESNAIDIANSCGTPVTVSADGIVIPDKKFGDGTSGWNGRYGLFVLVEHPNGTYTRYSHLSKIFVGIGDMVVKGERIGSIGNTGNSHGPTGCHLHFEVVGAKNPFATR